jgi:hypothetical protein
VSRPTTVLELMRHLHVAVVLPLLLDAEAGRSPSPLLLWRLRCGLSRLRRAECWMYEDRKYLVRTLEAASDPLSPEGLLELSTWLNAHGRRDTAGP